MPVVLPSLRTCSGIANLIARRFFCTGRSPAQRIGSPDHDRREKQDGIGRSAVRNRAGQREEPHQAQGRKHRGGSGCTMQGEIASRMCIRWPGTSHVVNRTVNEGHK